MLAIQVEIQPSYNNASVENTQTTLSDQVLNSALRYHSQAPLFDNLMNELGLQGCDVNGLTQGLKPKAE